MSASEQRCISHDGDNGSRCIEDVDNEVGVYTSNLAFLDLYVADLFHFMDFHIRLCLGTFQLPL